jgi:hypothetical protein
MSVTATIDQTKFNRALEEFSAMTRKDVSSVLRQQAGLVAVRAATIQPPNSGSGFGNPGSWAAQFKKGKERIEAQNFGASGAFIEARKLSLKAAKQAAKGSEHKFIFAHGGKRYVAPDQNVIERPNNSRMSAFRRPFWKQGRLNAKHIQEPREISENTLRLSKMVVSTSAKNSWLRHQWSKLGRAKAGWIRAAQATGMIGKLPAWVRRHSGSAGSATHYGTKDKEGWEIANLVNHANAMKLSTRVMQHALNYQAGQMAKQVAALMAKAAGKFNR